MSTAGFIFVIEMAIAWVLLVVLITFIVHAFILLACRAQHAMK